LTDLSDEVCVGGRSANTCRADGSRRAGPSRNGDESPSIRELEAILGVLEMLHADVQVVRDLASQRQVVRRLPILAIETVVVAGELPEADRAASRDDPRSAVEIELRRILWTVEAVLTDERLNESALHRVGCNGARHNEPSLLRQLRDVEM